ncbi:MAG: histidine phosphatase family protein [Chloroflexi bacterium]|nr:histidine phosphatase family protein [Chloroflexota bacterium]
MLLYYVRHAQSNNNALYNETGSYSGRSADAPLSATGKKQLPYLATFIQKELQEVQTEGNGSQRNVPVTLYCSLMERTVATASAIAETCQLPLYGYRDIHEVGGVYVKNDETDERIGMPGHDKQFFTEHYPLLHYPQGVDENGWWNRPHETREERPARARRVLEDILTCHSNPDEVVILVSHGEFFNHFINALLDMPPNSAVWFEMMNAAVSLFDFQPDLIQIPYINRHHFIPSELITG